ncbi:hypothetical protein A4A49_66087 [Nicotiana attenuata]|uniref:CLAVATA3/ESR (CLE)-related protein 45 n=1 Tax=Nicotiana attenuata TaxID=49451 RepID=A0A314L5S1_NICAT|nr:hypothetical protein A4A49_66087 [Nicotiana attenuata]
MIFTSQKPFVLLICIGLLAVFPEKSSSITSSQLVLRWSSRQQELMSRSQRVLAGLVTKELNTTNVKPAAVSKTFDPNRSSKRRVRKGSDPIHNRS